MINKTPTGIYTSGKYDSMPSGVMQAAKDAVRELRMRDEERRRRNKQKSRQNRQVDYNDVIVEDSVFETAIRLMLAKNFGEGNHFRVVREAKRYRPSKSRTVRNQMSGDEPEVVEIYFDQKYVCDVSEDMHPDTALGLIQTRLITALAK